MKLARALAEEEAELTAYDPNILNGESADLPDTVRVTSDVLTATAGTQAAVDMTEWSGIVESDWAAVSRNMLPPKFIFDARNALDPMIMRAAGFEYFGVGPRPTHHDVLSGWRNHDRTETTECHREDSWH